MVKHSTKEKVIDAASMLFFQKGFDGTSVRDIATKASVNVSLISYYFRSKQGLLEYAVTNYFETYLQLIETELEKNAALDSIEQFQQILYTMMKYKIDHYQLTAFIERELTLDSTFVREITMTYLAKENHLLKQLFFSVLDPKFRRFRHYLFMQLKGMLMSPFMFKEEWNYYLIDEKAYQQFLQQFTKTMHLWLEVLMIQKRQISTEI